MAIGRLRNPSGQEVLNEIVKEHEEYNEVNHGRLYPNLDTLIEEDYVIRGQRDRRTNEYRMTKAGAQYIIQRADDMNEAKEELRDQLASGSI